MTARGVREVVSAVAPQAGAAAEPSVAVAGR